MGYKNNGENWASECTEKSKNSKPQAGSGSLGRVSELSSQHGAYQIRTGGKDSYAPDNSVGEPFPSQSIPGKVVSQLIEETEKQIAYYEQQADSLRERLQELKEINLDTE